MIPKEKKKRKREASLFYSLNKYILNILCQVVVEVRSAVYILKMKYVLHFVSHLASIFLEL